MAHPTDLATAEEYFQGTLKCMRRIEAELLPQVSEAARMIMDAREVWIAGNGGSASTASHFAVDLSKTAWSRAEQKRIKTHALTDSPAMLTAIVNDLDPDCAFSYQMQGLIAADDVVVLISCSGESPNVIAAAREAKRHGAKIIALTSFDDQNTLCQLADLVIYCPTSEYGSAEDSHLMICHAITEIVKARES